MQSSPIRPSSFSSTLQSELAKTRVASYIDHQLKLMKSLKEQNELTEDFSGYKNAIKNIELISQKILASIEKNTDFKTKDLNKVGRKLLKKELQLAQRRMITIVRDFQIEILKSHVDPKHQKAVANLAKKNFQAKIIRFAALFFKSYREIIAAYHTAQKQMIEKSKTELPSQNLSQVDQDRLYAIEQDQLARRSGIIGINGIYRITPSFARQLIKKQIDSFMVQSLSEKERKTSIHEFSFFNEKFQAVFHPLNQAFDMALTNLNVSHFANLLGNKGIVSANRQEAHLVNAMETHLEKEGQTLFYGFRHAVISDKFEANTKVRRENSKKAATELVEAALLRQLANNNISLEQAAQRETAIALSINSASILTPDGVRPLLYRISALLSFFGIKKQANERQLLKDQVMALKSLASEEQTFTIDGKKIKVKVSVNCFNFGVNALSKGIGLSFLKLRFGLDHQFRYNRAAWKKMRQEAMEFTSKLPSGKEKENADILLKDIDSMLKNKRAYLKNGNQYEAAAKIMLLSHLMGHSSAFNCMSGKDRTNCLDSMIKAFAIMAGRNDGKYLTSKEIKNDPQIAAEFKEVFMQLLMEGGGLEITALNTDVKGYKVGSEIRLFGMTVKDFLQVKGLSHTTIP